MNRFFTLLADNWKLYISAFAAYFFWVALGAIISHWDSIVWFLILAPISIILIFIGKLFFSSYKQSFLFKD
jgi:hypothetical protein